MKQMYKSLFVMIAFILSFALIVPPEALHAAKSNNTEAKTPPPPSEFYIEGFFDPSFKYLDQGESNTLDKGNQTAEITVTTVAKQTVASIGATIYLEKWTGSAWVQVGTPAQLSSSNKMQFNGYAVYGIVSGYYYRARTVHWVSHNGVYEQGERVTNTSLAK